MHDSEPFETRRDAGALPMQLKAGLTVGGFELVELLGHGGMGQAWKAVDPRLCGNTEEHDGFVVLKFLPDELRMHPDAADEFRAEYRRVRRLHHQHICPLHELGEQPGWGCFQVMDYLPGSTLRALMRRMDPDRRGIPVQRVVEWLSPVAAALDYAHSRKLIHRDIKPENIMVDSETEDVHLIDFGLAAQVRTTMSRYSRQQMSTSGTAAYKSPEQWQGRPQYPASDQWSLAIVAWELLTGDLPYLGDGMELGFAICQASTPKLPDSLRQFQEIFETAFSKEGKHRFSSVTKFLDSLAREISAAPGMANRATALPPKVETKNHPEDDLAALLQRKQEKVARRHAQARQLVVQQQDYAGALEILEQTPEHLRQSALYETARQSAARVKELEASITEAVREVQLEGLREQVTELMQLQPQRVDMQRLLEQLPSEPVRPQRPEPLVAPFDAATARSAQQAWATYLGLDVEITNSLGMKFRVIPPGTFLMGSPAPEADRVANESRYKVTLTEPKLLGVHPVTQGGWERVMGGNPSRFSHVTGSDASQHPVEQVSWEMCQDYVGRLNNSFAISGLRYRLPTEAEWEYSCRAGTVTPFSFGDLLNGLDANCDGNYPYQADVGPYLERTSKVGQFSPNAFGLYDMHGNVWEWCFECCDSAGSFGFDDDLLLSQQEWDEDKRHVLRGGSWGSLAKYCRSAYRRFNCAAVLGRYVGFRLLCEFV